MTRNFELGICWLFGLFVATFATASEDPCRAPIRNSGDVRLTLVRAHVEAGTFVGEFELENLATESLSIPANLRNGTYYLRKPEIWVEYRSLASSWEQLPDAPRDNLNTDRLRIASRSKANFSAVLMTAEVANLQASDFQVVLRLFEKGLCVVSAPFRTTPIRPKAEGLETVAPQIQR
jgi:hypothetical protein